MYELIQISEHDYYIDCPAKIGIVKVGENEVVAIDSGNDKDAGKKVLKHIQANGWTLKAIYNTHSHADHKGGNKLLQDRTGCKVYAQGMEVYFTKDPILEPITLFGGFPFKELEHKFLMAQPSEAEKITPDTLPKGWELLKLPGHSFDMVGFRTQDNNVFLGDCVLAVETIQKYGIGFLWDPKAAIETLKKVRELKAHSFIPSHAPVVSDISQLAQANLDSIESVTQRILSLCEEQSSFETILQKVFETYGLQMTPQQYVLIGSTVRSYLSYLYQEGKVSFSFENNCMLWKKNE